MVVTFHCDIGFATGTFTDYGPEGEARLAEINVEGDGPFRIGAPSLRLIVPIDSAYDFIDKMEVRPYEMNGGSVTHRWPGSFISRRRTTRIKGSNTKIIDIDCQGYSILLDRMVGGAADADTIIIAGGQTFLQQIDDLWIAMTTGAPESINYIDGVANLITDPVMPEQSFKGLTMRAMMQALCNAAQAIDPALRPRFQMDIYPTVDSTYLGPYLRLWDGALAPSPVYHFTDETNPIGTGSYRGILSYNRDLEGTRLVNERQLTRRDVSTVFTAQDATSQGIYINPYSSNGYWRDAPLTSDATTDEEAQAEVDRSVASTAYPRETIDIEVHERVRSGQAVTVTWTPDSVVDENKRVVGAHITFPLKNNTAYTRTVLSLGARRLEYYEDGDGGVDVAPTEGDPVPPNAPTDVAVDAGIYDPTTGDALHTVTWVRSSSNDTAGYLLYRVQGTINYAPVDVPGRDTVLSIAVLFPEGPSAIYLKAYDGHGNLSAESNTVVFTAQEPSPAAEVFNPGYELVSRWDSTQADGWLKTVAGGGIVTRDNTYSHGGGWAIALDSTSGTGGTSSLVTSRYIRGYANMRHKISFWAKSSFAATALRIRVSAYSQVLAFISTATLVTGGATTTTWAEYVYYYTAPAGTYAMKVEIANPSGGGKILYADDVIAQVQPPTLGIPNPSFEDLSPNDPTAPDRWERVLTNGGLAVLDSTTSRGGTRSIKMTTATAGDKGEFRSDFFLLEEHDDGAYQTFGFWGKTSVSGQEIKATLSFYDPSYSGVDGVALTATSTSTNWTRYSFPLQITDYAYARVYFFYDGAAGSAWVDAVTLQPDPDAGFLQVAELTAPDTPVAGKARIYVKPSDKRAYLKNADGTEYLLGSNAGDTLPASPSTGDVFFYTGSGKNVWVYYDGTRWLGPESPISFGPRPASLMPWSAGDYVGHFPIRSDRRLYLTRFVVDTYIGSPNDGTDYWQVSLHLKDSGMVGQVDTSALSSGFWQPLEDTSFSTNPTVSADTYAEVEIAPAGSPGVLYMTCLVYVREVYT